MVIAHALQIWFTGVVYIIQVSSNSRLPVFLFLAERGRTKEGPDSQSTTGHEASAHLQCRGVRVGLSAPHQPPAVLLLLWGPRRVRMRFLPLLNISCFHSFSLSPSLCGFVSRFFTSSPTLNSAVDHYAPSCILASDSPTLHVLAHPAHSTLFELAQLVVE